MYIILIVALTLVVFIVSACLTSFLLSKKEKELLITEDFKMTPFGVLLSSQEVFRRDHPGYEDASCFFYNQLCSYMEDNDVIMIYDKHLGIPIFKKKIPYLHLQKKADDKISDSLNP